MTVTANDLREQARSAPSAEELKVWDPLLRLFHWSLAASFLVAWVSSEGWDLLHYWAGYAAGALVAFRLLWGLIGPRYARFSQFLRSPASVKAYLGDMLRGREKRYIGHNPAGGAMVLCLLAGMAALSFSGWLLTTDAYWGSDFMEELHELLANGLLALVLLHVGGVIFASLRHRENLARAMITGRKHPPAPGDVN